MVDVAEEVIDLGANLSTFFFFIRKADSEAIVFVEDGVSKISLWIDQL